MINPKRWLQAFTYIYLVSFEIFFFTPFMIYAIISSIYLENKKHILECSVSFRIKVPEVALNGTVNDNKVRI